LWLVIFMTELSLTASSISLLASACASLAISYSLRLKLKAIENLPSNLKVEIFDRSFVVFDPYPERRKSISNISSFLITFLSIIGIILAAIFWGIFKYGLAPSLFIIVAYLNLIFPDDLAEIYKNTDKIIGAIQSRDKLGSGDLTGLQILKKLLPRMIRYYSYLSAIFITIAFTLPLTWNIIISLFSSILSSLLILAHPSGLLGFQFTILLFSTLLVLLQLCIAKVKRRIVKWEIST